MGKLCTNCGEQMSDTAKFCRACGTQPAPVPDVPVADQASAQQYQQTRCSACGAQLDEGAKFCDDCGTPSGIAAPGGGEQAPPTPTPLPQCAVCGAAMEAGTRFCDACGASAQASVPGVPIAQPVQQAQPPLCTACGAVLEAGTRFCDICGAPAGAASPIAQPAQTGQQFQQTQYPQQYQQYAQAAPKRKIGKPHLIIGGVVIVAIAVVLFLVLRGGGDAGENYWPDNVFTQMLPKPESGLNVVPTIDEYRFITAVDIPTIEEAKAYGQQLKAAGFTVNPDEADYNDGAMYSYYAENAAGYMLRFIWSASLRNASLSIERPGAPPLEKPPVDLNDPSSAGSASIFDDFPGPGGLVVNFGDIKWGEAEFKPSDLTDEQKAFIIEAGKAVGCGVTFNSDGSVTYIFDDDSEDCLQMSNGALFWVTDNRNMSLINYIWPVISYTAPLPVPGFELTFLVIDEGKLACTFTGISYDELIAYVRQLEAAGFTIDRDELDLHEMDMYGFEAYNAAGQYVSILWASDYTMLSLE